MGFPLWALPTHVEHHLVQELQHVGAKHLRHQLPIDLAAQGHQVDVDILGSVALEVNNRLVVSVRAQCMGDCLGLPLAHVEELVGQSEDQMSQDRE